MKVLFYTRKTSSGLLMIYTRLIEDHEREAFSTGIKVSPEKWNQERQTISGRDVLDRQNSSRLERLKLKIYHEYDKLLLQDSYSIQKLKQVVLGQTESKQFLLKEFEKFISFNEQTKDGLSLGTIKKYKTIYKHLVRFVELEYRQKDIPIRRIKKTFIVKFWEYLRGPSQVNHNTGAKYIRHVKKVFNSFVEKGFLENHPFPNYSQRVIPEKKEFLSLPELQRIEQLDIKFKRLELIRDAFLFSCYTGLAFTDLKSLRAEHIHQSAVTMIKIPRQKTGVDSTVPVLPKPI